MKRLIALAMIGVVSLGACGGDDNDPAAGADTHNDADVTFAQGMIPHHEQAIEMAELADSRAASADVKTLAGRIEAAQAPEISRMKRWLEDWDEQLESDTGMAGMEHGGDGGADSGMMTSAEMGALSSAAGSNFDRLFLEMMIRHHESAVAMANTEVRDGEFAEAKELAGQIVRSQTAEIGEMRALLTTLPASDAPAG